MKWGLLKRNPCDAVDPPRVEKREMLTFDTAQTADALSEMRRTRFLVAYVLAAICGLRRGEIAALRWKNVDLERGTLRVVESLEQTKTGIRFKVPKSGRHRAETPGRQQQPATFDHVRCNLRASKTGGVDLRSGSASEGLPI